MRKEQVICDGCGCECDTKGRNWEYNPSKFVLKFPRDSINGGDWNMDVCHHCRHRLFDAIRAAVASLKPGCHEDDQDVNQLGPSEYMPMNDNDVPVFQHPNGLSTERNCAVRLMQMFGAPDWEFRERDKAIMAIAPFIQYEREQIAKQYGGWKETAEQNCRDVAYYQGLLDQIGETIGEPAYIADDGGKHDSVLRAKLPEIVASMYAGLRTLRDKMGLNEDWTDHGLMDMAQWVETMEAYRQQIIDIRAAMNLPPDHAAWQADLPALVKAAHLQWAEAVCELRGIKLQIRMDDAAFKVYDETLSQLTEARSIIETSLGLKYRDGGYYPLDDCNHDDEVEAMEALRKEAEVGRQ